MSSPSFRSMASNPPTDRRAAPPAMRVIQEFARAAGDPADLLLVAEDDGLYVDDADDALRRVLDRPLPFDVVVLADLWSREPRAHLRRALGATSQLSLFAPVIRTPRTTLTTISALRHWASRGTWQMTGRASAGRPAWTWPCCDPVSPVA